MLIGPRTLYPNIIGTWTSVDLYVCSAIFIDSIKILLFALVKAVPFFDLEKIKLISGLI